MIIEETFHNILRKPIILTPDGGKISEDGRTLPGFQEVTATDTCIGISTKDLETIS